MLKHALMISVSLSLASCISLEPKYERPSAPIPASLPISDAAAKPTTYANVGDIARQDFVKDEKLKQVIALALTNSRDLRKTIANIESARSQYRVQRAEQLPQVSAQAGGTRARTLTTSTAGKDSAIDTESWSAGGTLSSFEIDLFGKQRSLSKAAYETYLSTAEAGRATRISLIASTAQAYATLAADIGLHELAQRTLDSAKRSLDVTQRRQAAGVASRLDVTQAQTLYQQAETDAASLTATIAQDRNALDLLVGAHVDDALIPEALSENAAWFADVPVGLSSEILLGRPDVLEAEHQLKSANANIGAARAAFFPSLSLTASGGAASSDLSNLFNAATGVWSIAPNILLPIFNGGANSANLAYSKAQRDLYASNYELTIQTAFKEVADALAVNSVIQRQVTAQSALVVAASESYQISDARYRKGVDSFLNALDSQRTLYSAQKTLMNTRLAAVNNRITLYLVLGGGVN